MSDTDVHSQVSEFSSKDVIQEQRRLDMNTCQDLPPLAADSNGIKHVVGDQDDGDGVNAGGKDDVPGGSYVFVTSTDVIAADPATEDFVANSKVSSLSNGTIEQLSKLETEDAKVTVSNVDDVHNCVDDSLIEHHDEALPSQLDASAIEVASAITVDKSSETVNPESDPQMLVSMPKVEDPIELHSVGNLHTSVVATTADLVHEKAEILSSNGANLTSVQSNGLDSIAELGQSEKCQNVVLEAAESVENGEVKPEELDNLESTPEPEKSEVKTCQNSILDAVECGSLDVQVDEVRSEERPELKLAKEIVEHPQSQNMTSESGLCQLDNKESEAQIQLKSVGEVVDSPDSQITELDGSGLHQLDNWVENLEIETSPDLVLDDSAGEIKDNPVFEVTIAESRSYQHNSGEGIDEGKKTELGIDAKGSREINNDLAFQIAVIDSVESGPYQPDHEEIAEDRKKTDLNIDLKVHEESVTDVIMGHEGAKVNKETDVRLHGENPEDISLYGAREVTETESYECIDSSEKVAKSQLPENAESLCSINKCEKVNENMVSEKAESLSCLNNCVTSESELGDMAAESVQSLTINPSDEGTAIEQDVSYEAPILKDEVLTCEIAEETVCETGAKKFAFENSESSLFSPASDVKSEIFVKNNHTRDVELMSSFAKYGGSETKIVFGSIDPESEVQSVDVHVGSKPANGHIQHAYGSHQNGNSYGMDPKSEVDNPRSSVSSTDLTSGGSRNVDLSAIYRESAPNSVAPCILGLKTMEDQVNGCHGGSDSKVIGLKSDGAGSMHIDDVPASLTVSSSNHEVQSAPNYNPEIAGVEIPACLAGISSSIEGAPNSDPEIVGVEANGDTSNKIICEEHNGSVEVIHGDGMPLTSVREAMDAEAAVVARPFHFLIRIPRLEDEKLKEQIGLAKIQIEDKTRLRDNIRMEIQAKRACCQSLDDAFEVAKSEEIAARRLVREKRQEIDSALSVMNKVKNAISVEDIDRRMYNMEHMINHETLPLKEEKQIIREMKQMRVLKEQLTSSMGSKDEVQQAMDQKDEVEERLKILKKELDSLKAMVSKAEAKSTEAGRKYEEEFMLLRELQAQFRAADDIRQEEYKHFLSLKRQAYEKNKHYWKFKDDIRESFDCAKNGDLVGLHRACVNQVEKFMEQWNKDDEFRKEYVRCNMRSTLRRLRTLDGRSLGPDEVPPEMPSSYVNNRNIIAGERFSNSQTDQVNMMSHVQTPLEQEKQAVSHAEREVGGEGKSASSSIQQSNQRTAKTEKIVKPIISRENGVAAAVSSMGDYNEPPKEEKKTEELESNMLQQEQVKEDHEELAKKAAELEAKLKEQRRLEEKAKAQEALERKRRNAEKAQIRAALKAQKEAEEKEKERERRLKKKERKKMGISEGGQDEGDNDHQTSEIKGTEKISLGSAGGSSSSKPPVAASSSYFRKQSKLKSIPPPPAPIIRNRSAKKRMQQLMWVVIASIALVTFFLFGSNSYFIILKQKSAA